MQFSVVLIALLFFVTSDALNIKPRIVGGRSTQPGQFPYFVFLESNARDGRFYEYGGSLIHPRWVLTAAHCLENITERVTLHFGLNDLDKYYEAGRLSMEVSADSFKRHPMYKKDHVHDDIALIKLPRPVQVNSFVWPIKLSKHTVNHEPKDVITMGFGRLQYGGESPTKLQYAPLTITPMYDCISVFPFLLPNPTVLCASGNDKQSICTGEKKH